MDDENGKSPAANRPGLNESANSKNLREGRKFLAQKKNVFKAFFGPPKSMLEVEAITGIMRSNITWYVDDWLKTKSIQRVRTGFCSITLRKVGRYSSNPMYWEKGGENGG
jgi:hypothetical protein